MSKVKIKRIGDTMNLVTKIIFLSATIACGYCQGITGPIKTPPQIITPFRNEYYVTEGNTEPKWFQCSATGYPPPRYEWKKDGVKLISTQLVSASEINGTLTIIHAQFSDFAKYQCFATNELGTAVSAAFDLKRGYILPFQDTGHATITVDQYDTVKLPCEGKAVCRPKQDCRIEWKRGIGTTESVVETPRIALDSEGTLYFLYVLPQDQKNESLACGMNHEPAKAFYKGKDLMLTVKPVKHPPIKRPPNIEFHQDVKGLLDGDVTLQCVFSGYPIPDIYWYTQDGTEIDSTRGTEKFTYVDKYIRRNLIIKKLSEKDEGEYRCKARNDEGEAEATVYVNVTSKPIFPKFGPRMGPTVVSAGDDAKFTCKMRSLKGERPPTAPFWRRDGLPLPQDQIGPDSKYHLTENKTVLTIKNVQKPGDTCNIMCETGNVIIDDNGNDKFVKSYAEATLRIIDPIEVNVISRRTIELYNTSRFSLAFSATTDKSINKLFFNWTFVRFDDEIFSNNVLQTLPWVRFYDSMRNLTVSPEFVDVENIEQKLRQVVGKYYVTISHMYDKESVIFEVVSKYKPPQKAPVIVQSAGFEMWYIGVIAGVIVLFIVVMFIICTLYRNRGGEYPVDKKEVAAGHDPENELMKSGFQDLSRADDKMPPDNLSDHVNLLDSDDDDEKEGDITQFNEDGSFIGVYVDKKAVEHENSAYQNQSDV